MHLALKYLPIDGSPWYILPFVVVPQSHILRIMIQKCAFAFGMLYCLSSLPALILKSMLWNFFRANIAKCKRKTHGRIII